MIIIDCNGGLGNRLRPILSCLSTKQDCRIYWANNTNCHIKLEKILKLKNLEITLNEIIKLNYSYFIRMITPFSKYRESVKKSGKLLNENNLDKFLSSNKNFYYSDTGYLPSNLINKELYPSIFNNILDDKIKNKALDLKKKLKLSTRVIACHLRATDRRLITEGKVENDKIENIINKIQNEENKIFFVCSDEKILEDRLKILPNVVLYEKRHYSTVKNIDGHIRPIRSENSIIDAMIDLCCLSFCNTDHNEFHSCPGSAFLDLSRAINGWEIYHYPKIKNFFL